VTLSFLKENTVATTHFSGLNIKFATIAEGAAGNHTVTGISPEDTLLAVVGFTAVLSEGTPNTVAFTARNLTSEFSISAANTINNGGGTALTDGCALVVYLDKDAA
jgi:hypothetical protein